MLSEFTDCLYGALTGGEGVLTICHAALIGLQRPDSGQGATSCPQWLRIKLCSQQIANYTAPSFTSSDPIMNALRPASNCANNRCIYGAVRQCAVVIGCVIDGTLPHEHVSQQASCIRRQAERSALYHDDLTEQLGTSVQVSFPMSAKVSLMEQPLGS